MTNPIVKTLDDPLIEVIVLAKSPPVHDSANETVILFFMALSIQDI